MEGNFDDVFKTRPYPAGNGKNNAFAPTQTTTYADPAGIVAAPASHRLNHGRKTTGAVHLSPGDSIELNSISYVVKEIVSGAGRSSEAVIYRITSMSGKDFALKLYYEFPDESLEPGADTLQRIREISGGEILGLFDFGTGPNKFLNGYCFEISDFAYGGDLISVENLKQKFTPEFIENVVVTGIFHGIQKLHREKIYHCDLKPHNVFFLDQDQTQVVIGDYGSAKSFDKANAKELNYTTLTRGTEFYLAPEQAFGIVSEKNDYYSLGMIVLHLLYPEFVSHENLRRIFERRTRGIQIVDFDERFPRLNRLIEGLTLQDYNLRWGHREVARWIDGLDVPIGYQQADRKIRLRVGTQEMLSGKDLANYIQKGNPFYESLIEDRDGYGMLLTWIDAMEGEESRKTFDAMISHYKKYYGIDYVKQAILAYFKPADRTAIGPKQYDFADPEKLPENLQAFFAQIDKIWKFTDIGTLRFYFFLFEFAVRRLRVKSTKTTATLIDDTFRTIAEIAGSEYDPDFTSLKAGFHISLDYGKILEIIYAFTKGRVFRDHDNRRYESLFEVNAFFEADHSRSSDCMLLLERDAFVKRTGEEEFLEFIGNNPDWHRFFLSDVSGLDLLTVKLSEILSERYTRTFIDGFCKRMAELDPEYYRIAIQRITRPGKSFAIGGREIALYSVGDFNNKVREIFGLLDKQHHVYSLDQSKALFFEFEFTLLQLAAADPINEKILVRPLFTKMAEVLGDFGGDIASLQPFWFQKLNNQKLIGLFYLFNPIRNFSGDDGEVITNIREMGLYFARQPAKYHDQPAADERDAFLENRNYRSFIGLNLQEFLMKIFRDQAQLSVDIRDIILGEPEYHQSTVIYDYQLSLDAFFAKQNIPFVAVEKNHTSVTAVLKGGQFTATSQLYHQFAGIAIRRHQPAARALQGDSEKDFFAVLKQRKHEQHFGGISLLPKYLAFMLPVIAVLYFVVKYLSGALLTAVFGQQFSFEAELTGVRLTRESLPVLIAAAYFLNLLLGAALLLAFGVVFHNRKLFYRFFDYHAGLLRRLLLFMIFAPVVAIVAYLLLNSVFDSQPVLGSGATGFSLTTVVIILYTGLLLHQLISLVVELFRMYRKLYILPFVLSLLFFLIFGYYSMIRPYAAGRYISPVENAAAAKATAFSSGTITSLKPDIL